MNSLYPTNSMINNNYNSYEMIMQNEIFFRQKIEELTRTLDREYDQKLVNKKK